MVYSAAGQDYFAVAETVTLTSTATRQCFSVTILDDLFIVEDRESFLLQLTTSDPNVIVTTPTATVFIDDNDEGIVEYESVTCRLKLASLVTRLPLLGAHERGT